MKQELTDKINFERNTRGICTVLLDDKLSIEDQKHSDDMQRNNFVSHIGSNGSTYITRTNAAGNIYKPLGEIILKGPGGKYCLEAAVRWWMQSYPHRQILLETTATYIGIGISLKNNRYLGNYFAILFAKI